MTTDRMPADPPITPPAPDHAAGTAPDSDPGYRPIRADVLRWLAPPEWAVLLRRYVLSGALWGVVASVAALAALVDLSTGLRLAVPVLGVGRLQALYLHVVLWGALSLPLAGGLLDAGGIAAGGRSGVGRAHWAWVLWNAGVALGAGAIVAGGMTAAPWAVAPAPVLGVVGLGAGLWCLALWSTAGGAGRGLGVAGQFALVAAIGLLASLFLGLVAGAGLDGIPQALAGAMHGRAALALWLAPAGMALAATVLPRAAGSPLYGRRAVSWGLWSWFVAHALTAARDLAPDLLPTWLAWSVQVMTPLLVVPGVLVAVAFLGTFVGRPARAPRPGSARLLALGIAVLASSAIADALALPVVRQGTQFTAWNTVLAFFPPLLGPGMLAMGATWYALEGRVARLPVGPARHGWLVIAGGALGVAPLAVWGLAQMAGGEPGGLLRLASLARLPGAALWLAAWMCSAINAGVVARAEVAAGTPPGTVTTSVRGGPQPAALAGVAATIVVAVLFSALFLPLVDPSGRPTARGAARAVAAGTLPDSGRATYIGEGCVVCHTQRVRATAADASWGPPTQPGDFAGGPALVGFQRVGQDLAWVGDRYGTIDTVTDRLRAHARGAVVAYPWLVDGTGLTARGAPLVDYLLQLRSQGAVAP